MIVTNENFSQCVKDINSALNIAVDTETTGLKVYHGDRLFSIIVSTDETNYYFNYNSNGPSLNRADIPKIIHPDYKGRIFFHNAKFDIKMLEHEGLNLRWHRIYDVAGLARIEFNDRLLLRLANLASMVGDKKKGDIVDEYIKEHKLFTEVHVPSKKEAVKDKHYDQVPFDLMSDYGCKDGELTIKLGHHLLKKIAILDSRYATKGSNLKHIIQTENKLTPILMEMQDDGLPLNVAYCEEALEYEKNSYAEAARDYEELTGIKFIDSNKNHSIAFDKMGLKYPLTEKGNPSFKEEFLESMDDPIANIIKRYRKSYKKAHTYFANFLYMKDDNDVIHAALNQYKARTGRMSSSEPNLQNLKRTTEDEKYPVRGAFGCHAGDINFFLDYDQFEYRMMLNKAKEMRIIEQILGGLDVHTATANLMEKPRQQAKTINFLLLYGGGLAVLARKLFTTHLAEHTLKEIQKYYFFRDFLWSMDRIANEMKLEYWEVEHGVEILSKAKELKEIYFTKLPAVKTWVNRTVSAAERGYVFNEFGRAYKFPKKFAFKAPNYLIQGGTADFLKNAMVKMHEFLLPYNSRMLLQVHDEIQFGIKPNEVEVVHRLKEIMEFNPRKEYLPYTVGIDYSETSWANKRSYDG